VTCVPKWQVGKGIEQQHHHYRRLALLVENFEWPGRKPLVRFDDYFHHQTIRASCACWKVGERRDRGLTADDRAFQ
jgi:hypothetical protein